ncbi:MAG: hypothetical protein EOO14_25860 [Chitinophagaceae bacterium]|nr:MAG: hypothetical protein EOO14_25860 [Chitinophagaceae bacterium]
MSALPQTLLNFKTNLHQQRSKSTAWAIIDDYFSFFDHEAWRKDLWQMLVGTVTSEQMDQLEKAMARLDLFFFYEYTTMVLEAVALLRAKKKKYRKRNRREW